MNLKSGKYDNNIGSQYVLMVQRPNNGPYIMLNLNAESITNDKDTYSKILDTINGLGDNPTYNPNNDVFLSSQNGFSIKTKEGIEIPVHLSFDRADEAHGGGWYIKREPKYYKEGGKIVVKDINGNNVSLDGVKYVKRLTRNKQETIEYLNNFGKVRIKKDAAEATDLDFLKDKLTI